MFAYDFPDYFCCMFVAYVFVIKHALCVCVCCWRIGIFSPYHLRMFRIVLCISFASFCSVLHLDFARLGLRLCFFVWGGGSLSQSGCRVCCRYGLG